MTQTRILLLLLAGAALGAVLHHLHPWGLWFWIAAGFSALAALWVLLNVALAMLLRHESVRERGVPAALNLAITDMRARAQTWRDLAVRTDDPERHRLAHELAGAHDGVANLLHELRAYEAAKNDAHDGDETSESAGPPAPSCGRGGADRDAPGC